ncbi:hypothetical protein BR93DRAFT_981971 [Coniochaeta sp. PMI_546]|nr:hypothetical protein BR93DRAFT_981971 [Coniochaeta sp. PMI_546]
MAPAALVDFTPSGIDMVFAVSQQNLNQGLAEYIQGLNAQVSWGFDVDDAGNLTAPADPTKPDISFSGTLAPPTQPAGGAPVWIVDMSQAGAANQVTFNLTFEDGATFTDHQTGRSYKQSAASGGALWVIPFQVDLTLAALSDTSNLPAWLQKQLAILNGNYGEVFDLSQVLLDLQTLASTVDPKSVLPAGILLYEWTLIIQGMSQYMKAHSGEIFITPPSAGYAHRQLRRASTLVFVLMVQGAALPNAPANAFTDVTLIADPGTTPGVALIDSPRLSVESDQDGVTWQLAQSGTQATSSAVTPTSSNGGTFLSFSMPTQTSNVSHYYVGGGDYSANSATSSTITAAFSSPQQGVGNTTIAVGGTLSMSDSPTFNWNWSAYYAIQSVNAGDVESGGGVQFVLQIDKSTFPTTPDFVGNLLAPVIQQLPVTFKAGITSLAGLGSFVFPGGGTFTFQSPAVNNAFALYSTIQYQNPN